MSDHKDILDLDVKFRHIKMWLLHKRGLSRKEIAELLGGTNPGAVGNEIKKYEKDPARRKMAEEQLAPFASSVAKGAAVEAEHGKLYDEIVARLKKNGATMPMSREEFFKEIASAHLAEKKDYYELLEKYVEKNTPAKKQIEWHPHPQGGEYARIETDGGFRQSRIIKFTTGKAKAKRLVKFQTPLGGNSVGIEKVYYDFETCRNKEEEWLISGDDSKYLGDGERLAGTGTKLNPANASTPEGGGLLVGVKHTPQGRGIEVETPEGKIKAEGGEILLNAKTSERLCEQLSAESVKDGGVAFPCEKTDSVQGPMKGGGGQLGGGGQISKDAKWALDMGDKTSYIDMLERHKDDTNLTPLQKQKIKFALEMRDEIYLRDALQHMAGDGTKTGIVPQDNPEGYDFTIEKITDWDDDGNPISKKTIKHFQLEKDAKKAFFKAVDRYGVNWGSIEFYHGIADASDDEIILKIRPSSKPDSAQGPMAGNGGMAGDGAQLALKPYYTLTKEETIAERDALHPDAFGDADTEWRWGQTLTPAQKDRWQALSRHSIAEWGVILDELK